jgi:hypothetical protein
MAASEEKRSVREIQQALLDRGFDPRGVDNVMGDDTRSAIRAFQHSVGLYVDGVVGKNTLAALFPAAATPPASIYGDLPASWLPKATIRRAILHWTAGGSSPSPDDLKHYHVLWDSTGRAVRGVPTIDKNDASGARTGYAAHTLNCNTGSIGASLCGMRGAVESPFSPGPSPITRGQWDSAIRGLAQMCLRYGIPVTPQTVLTHAEVQDNLGIRQKGKWDIARLPFDTSVVGARAVGDLLRRQVSAEIQRRSTR